MVMCGRRSSKLQNNKRHVLVHVVVHMCDYSTIELEHHLQLCACVCVCVRTCTTRTRMCVHVDAWLQHGAIHSAKPMHTSVPQPFLPN
jgi:hypothetical protein